MKKLLIIGLGLLLFVGFGCTPTIEKNILKLVEEMNIPLSSYSDSCRIVVIPGNGCSSCIRGALDRMRNSEDKLYVFVCRSEKEFSLQTGKKASSFRNLYLDKENHSYQLTVLTTYPMVYLMQDGKYVSHAPYQSDKPEGGGKNLTAVMVEQSVLNLGEIKREQSYRDSIKLMNIGPDTLFIQDIRSSCDCTQVEWTQPSVAPRESVGYPIVFHPDTSGYFEREIEIWCNVKESPIRILVKGTVVE